MRPREGGTLLSHPEVRGLEGEREREGGRVNWRRERESLCLWERKDVRTTIL